MSHSMHRVGDEKNLWNDFTIVVRPERGYNNLGSRPKLQMILRELHNCKAVNITAARGEKYKGNIYMTTIDEIIDGIEEGKSLFATFDNQENLERFLQFLIEKDFGFSIVVQGVLERVEESLRRVGLTVHTTNHSLGIWGKKENMAHKSILEITTMCGHGMVSPYLVEEVIEKVKNGKTSVHEGAVVLSKQCLCGIFNTTRAEALIERLTQNEEDCKDEE